MERFGVIDEAPVAEVADEMEVMEGVPKDDMEADECLQKIGNWERFRKFWLDYYAKKIDEVNAKCDRNVAWQKRKLRYFFKSVPHRSTQTFEAYDLPSGRISLPFRKKKLVPDKVAIIARLEKEGAEQFIKVEKKLDWKGYMARLFISDDGNVFDSETGEEIKDVSIEEEEPDFAVKVKESTSNGEDE